MPEPTQPLAHAHTPQLISYIAHAAPATRRPATGDEAYLRPEFGFTPEWYLRTCEIDFGERWHTDPAYRAETVVAMAQETRRRFGDSARIGPLQAADGPTDLITGTYGALLVPALYEVPIRWKEDDWPWCEPGVHLTDDQIRCLQPPDLDNSPLWAAFMQQLDWIDRHVARLDGFINWQSVINTGYRLRGEQVFLDMRLDAGLVRHLFDCIVETMIAGARRLYARQAQSGVVHTHFTVSNCLVNMLSPADYRTFILPYDLRIAGEFATIGIHNCAWNASPYLADYATVPRVSYMDMGLESDLSRARELFPHARRALMYTPMDLADKSLDELAHDLERIAQEYGPCDLVCADIDVRVPDERVLEVLDLCRSLSETYGA